ncbi:50S ribosomal protein L4 [Patescibacteria group bacterium]|nr:50S ribosomal protein L4 [Patescibacteria group bacterium]MBU4162466.1 50S ribosomal protein L4 [Patescibacteria group bacterium]
MKIDVYNSIGEKSGQMELPKKVFDRDPNPDLVHQAVISMQSNKRNVIAHTKDRSEVSGGGKKPWRQKGTGRARHGSSRSPIWIGGGVTFGPTNKRNFKMVVPKKMKKMALFSILSDKVRNQEISVIDNLTIEEAKTKTINKILTNLLNKIYPEQKKGKKRAFKSVLIILDKKDDKLIRAVRNIPKINIIDVRNLSILDAISTQRLIFLKDSIKTIKELSA